MKFRKFTATIALTAVLSSSIASSLTPLTVLATDGEDTATTEAPMEETKDSKPVQENDAPAELPSEPTAESAENKVEETKQEEPAPEKEENEASYDGSASFDAETTDKEGSKASDGQGTSKITTVESGTEESATGESKEIASKEEAGSSEASTEASHETASESEEEKTYTLSFESLCGDESLGSGSVSLKLSNDYITIESGEPHYPDCELVSTEVAGYTLSDGKLSGADDAKSVLDGGANVTFRFRSTKPEETAITLHAVARDTDGNEIRKLSDLSYTLKKDETEELYAPDAADFAAETDEEKITYTYLRTEVDGAERNTISTADDGQTVAFIYQGEGTQGACPDQQRR